MGLDGQRCRGTVTASHVKLRTFRGFTTAAALALTSCGILGPDLDTEGVVGFWEGEGGCWSISTDTENFHPTDLPQEFRVVGLRVRFQAERTDLSGFCPGAFIRLLHISQAD